MGGKKEKKFKKKKKKDKEKSISHGKDESPTLRIHSWHSLTPKCCSNTESQGTRNCLCHCTPCTALKRQEVAQCCCPSPHTEFGRALWFSFCAFSAGDCKCAVIRTRFFATLHQQRWRSFHS